MNYTTIPNQETINKAISALKENGIEAISVATKDAKQKVLDMLPKGAEVIQMTSVTLDALGISEAINSADYDAVKPKLYALDRQTQGRQMSKMGSAPDYAVGSFQAITLDGKIVIASNTGSQIPAYAYGSDKIIFVASANKIVKDLDEAMDRVYNHALPLESERAKKAYGVDGSSVNKMLIINKEPIPGRITVILVDEVLGQ